MYPMLHENSMRSVFSYFGNVSYLKLAETHSKMFPCHFQITQMFLKQILGHFLINKKIKNLFSTHLYF